MKGFINLFKKDIVVALRNALFWVLIATMLLMIIFVKFLIPEDFNENRTQFLYDKSDNKVLEQILKQAQNENIHIVSSEEALYKAIKDSPYGVGIVFDGSIENPQFTIIHQNMIGKENQNVINASLESMMAAIKGVDFYEGFEVTFLREQAQRIPRNLFTLPPMLVFEVLITGFLFVAVFMFQEKNEGSIRAYRMTPGGIPLYILSKTMVFIVVGMIYGVGFVLLTMGVSVNFLQLSLLIILGASLYTLLGIIVAVFFNSISDWFLVGLAVLTFNMAPLISYIFPSFAPAFLTWIPSYPILFAFEEILFSIGRSFMPVIQRLIIGNILAYCICHVLVDRRLMKEGR